MFCSMVGDPVVCQNNETRSEESSTDEAQNEVSKKNVEQKEHTKLASITDFFHPKPKGNRKQNATIVGFFKTRTEENLEELQTEDNINSEEERGHKTVDLHERVGSQEQDTCNYLQGTEPSQSQCDNQPHKNVESGESDTITKNICETSLENMKQNETNADDLACAVPESQNKSICETVFNSELTSDGAIEKKHKPPKWSLSWKPSTKSCKSVKKRPSISLNSSDSDFEDENVKHLWKRKKAGRKKRKQEVEKCDPVDMIAGDVFRQPEERAQKDSAQVTQSLQIGEQECPQTTQKHDDTRNLELEEDPEYVGDVGASMSSEDKDISVKTLQQEAPRQPSGPSVFDVLMKKTEIKQCEARESDQSLLTNDTDCEKQSQSVDQQAVVEKSSKCKSREFKLSIRMVPKKTKKNKAKNEVECDKDDIGTATKLEEDVLYTFSSSVDREGEKRQDAKLTNKKVAEKKINKKKRKERTLKVSDNTQDGTTLVKTVNTSDKSGRLIENSKEEHCATKGKDVTSKKGKVTNVAKPRGRPKKAIKSSYSDDFEMCTDALKQQDNNNKEMICSVAKSNKIAAKKKSKRATEQARDKRVVEKKIGGDKKAAESRDDSVEQDKKHGEQSNEIVFVDESSLETNSAPVSKSLRSKDKTSLQQTIAVEENADKIVAKPTEPVKLAPIFMRPKSKPKQKAASLEDKVVHQEASSSDCTEGDTLQPDNPVLINIDAANKAFSALFTGARSSKTVPSGSTAVPQTPAPWPVYSHVMQKEEFGTGSASSLNVSKSKLFDLVETIECEEPALLSQLQFVGNSVLGLLPAEEEDGLNASDKMTKETTEKEKLPEDVIKKLVSELGTVHYPGIKVKRLFKRYRAKHQSLAPAVLEGSKKNLVQAIEDKSVSTVAQTEFGRKTKRKLSCNHSESQTKIPRIESEASLDNGVDNLDEKPNKPTARGCSGRGAARSVKEEESDHILTRRSKRLSGRLQPRKSATEEPTPSKTDLESHRTERQRKRRKTSKNDDDSLDKTVPHCTVTGNKSSDTLKQNVDSYTSTNLPVNDDSNMNSDSSKKQDDHGQVVWTDRYQPSCAAEVMANASSVAKMKAWLGEWKIKREKTLRKEMKQKKKLLAKEKGKTGSKTGTQTVEWWDQDSDSDFDIEDASDDSDGDNDQGLCNTMLVTGAGGVGKTAMVYACARELGYKVFEVNCSSKRSGKHILAQLEEATQSHQVIGSKSATSMFQGAMKSPTEQVTNKIPSSSPLAAFLKPVIKPQEEKKERKSKNKSGKHSKNVKEKKPEPVEQAKSFPAENPTASNSGLSIKAASLILFEEVDVVFEEDKGFWAAVGSFMQNAKCPIIMTSNEFHLACDGRYEHICIKPVSVPLLAAHLQLICLLNNLLVSPDELKAFVASTNCDIRKCLLSLQFWAESGGGLRLPYEIREANRPAIVREVEMNEESNSSGRNEAQILTRDFSESQAVDEGNCHNKEDLVTSKADALCNPVNEESMFLSVDEFKQITSKGQTENSVSMPSCRLTSSLATEVTSDSVADASELSLDSQSVDVKTGMAVDTQLFPYVHHLLVESATGILNCHPCAMKGATAFLKMDACRKEEDDKMQDRSFTAKCSVTSYCQSLDVNLVRCNLAKLMPSLFTDSLDPNETASKEPLSVSHSNQSVGPARSIILQNVFFQDKSLFDDGTETHNDLEPNPSQRHESNGGAVGGIFNTRRCAKETSELSITVPSDAGSNSQETSFSGERSTGFEGQCGLRSHLASEECSNTSLTRGDGQLVNTECNEEIEKYLQMASLEVFCHLAEDLSFMDANIPKLTPYKDQHHSTEFGWWHAKLRPNLADDVCRHQYNSAWVTRETRAGLRGAVEIASVESNHAKFQSFRERISNHYMQSKETEISNLDGNLSRELETELVNKMCPFLPPRDPGGVLQMASRDDYKSCQSSREKLYRNVSSALPTSLHCIHKVAATEYLPSLRAICHAERIRETAKTKRRFLHYLDSNSFTISRSNQDSLADAFLLS